MTYSVDTNVIFSIINRHEPTHHRSIELLEKRKDGFVLFFSVLQESKTAWHRKYNEAFVKIIEIIKKINEKKLKSKFEVHNEFFRQYKKLLSDKKLDKFYKYIYGEIKDSLIRGRYSDISKIGSEISIQVLTGIEDAIERYAKNRIEYTLDEELTSKIKEIGGLIITYKIKFKKDEYDQNIFLEAAAYSEAYKDSLDFFSWDKDFCSKSNEIIIILRKSVDHKELDLDFYWLENIN